MLRALVAIVGVLLIGSASTVIAAPCGGFTDVDDTNPATAPFCANVTWIKNRGITLGCPSTGAPLYCPNDSVSRLQMAAFMNRLGNVTFQQGGNAFGGVARVGTTDNQPVEVLVNGAEVLRIVPNAISPNVLAGYNADGLVYPGVYGASIGGGGAPGTIYQTSSCPRGFGCQNSATDHFGTIGGGAGNLVGDKDADLTNGSFATVGGGLSNEATDYATVGGGFLNRASSSGTVGGGAENQALGDYSTVVGGVQSQATGRYSVAGGFDSRAEGTASIAFGYDSRASANLTVAIGVGARANHSGAIVLSDGSTGSQVTTGASNQFIARALGGFYFFTSGTSDATYQGAWLAPGTSAWAPFSDRDGKEAIVPVDADDVLRKVAAMPLSTWQWKSEPNSVRHMGPMAQDFHSAFGLGTSNKHIVTVDADGVALAAIQGLNAKVEGRLAAKDAEIAALRAELAEIRSLLTVRGSASLYTR